MNNATLADSFVPGLQSASNLDTSQNLSSVDAGPSFGGDMPLMEQDLVEMLVPTLLEAEKEQRQQEHLMQRVLPSVAPGAFGGAALTEELTHVYAVSVLIQSVWLSERLRIKTVRVMCLVKHVRLLVFFSCNCSNVGLRDFSLFLGLCPLTCCGHPRSRCWVPVTVYVLTGVDCHSTCRLYRTVDRERGLGVSNRTCWNTFTSVTRCPQTLRTVKRRHAQPRSARFRSTMTMTRTRKC